MSKARKKKVDKGSRKAIRHLVKTKTKFGGKHVSMTLLAPITPSMLPGFKDTNPKDAIGISKAALGSVLSAQVTGEASLGMVEGACKYRRHNYRIAGVRASVYYDACKRHMDAWWEGEDMDPDAAIPIHHVSKAISDLYVLRDAMLHDMFVDDRPPPAKNKNWIADLNRRTKELISKFPDAKAPYTQADVKPKRRKKK